MKRSVPRCVLSSILASLALLASPVPAWAAMSPSTELASTAVFQANAKSEHSAISDDARYVAFESEATNLDSRDTDSAQDIYVRDRRDGYTHLISLTPLDTSGNGMSVYPAIAARAATVAFHTSATNLIPGGDSNGSYDIYVRDFEDSDTCTRVSVTDSEGQANGSSYLASISDDGRYVAFESDATNLVSGDTLGHRDIFVRDRTAGTTKRVSLSSAGTQAGAGCFWSSISGDGRYVAFYSTAANLTPMDTNGVSDVFVRDTQLNTTKRVSVSSAGTQATSISWFPKLSADGRFVAFNSDANNLVAGDTAWPDVFVRDTKTNTTTRVSLTSTGGQATGTNSLVDISSDGRYVLFHSDASNVVPNDTNGVGDLFVRDRVTNTTTRVSVAGAGGTQANGASYTYGGISGNGRFVGLTSSATNLIPIDTNGVPDVFVRDSAKASLVRVAGADRYDTAVAIARSSFDSAGFKSWPLVKHVVIASGEDRAAADPLSAAGLCYTYDAPLLLVSSTKVASSVKTALKEIVAANGKITVHIVGGPASVPDARYNEIAAAVGAPNVTKDRLLSTGDRYDMAAQIAKRRVSVKGGVTTVLVANGADSSKFFDALALSPVAARRGWPILLVGQDRIPNATAKQIEAMGTKTIYIGGGSKTVSDAIKKSLDDKYLFVYRLSGPTRYETAVEIAKTMIDRDILAPDQVGTAAKLPDALTGGSMMGRSGGYLLVTDTGYLPASVGSWLSANRSKTCNGYVLGGTKSVTSSTMNSIRNQMDMP